MNSKIIFLFFVSMLLFLTTASASTFSVQGNSVSQSFEGKELIWQHSEDAFTLLANGEPIAQSNWSVYIGETEQAKTVSSVSYLSNTFSKTTIYPAGSLTEQQFFTDSTKIEDFGCNNDNNYFQRKFWFGCVKYNNLFNIIIFD
jgi:hypothetical protein